MKQVSSIALGAALAFGAATGLAIAPAAAQESSAATTTETVEEFEVDNISEGVRTAVAAAQAALEGGETGTPDTSTALAQLQSAQSLIQNDDDRFIIGQLLIQTSVTMQQAGATAEQIEPLQRTGVDLSLQSNRVAADRRGALYRAAAGFARRAEDYPRAIELYQRSMQYPSTDPQVAPDTSMQLAAVYFDSGNAEAGYAAADEAIAAFAATGQPVPESWYAVAYTTAANARDVPRSVQYGTMLLRAYPTEQNWHDVLVNYQITTSLDDQANLDLLRLMRATGSLEANTYSEYISVAELRGLPGEAKAVYDEAVAASALPVDQEQQATLTASAQSDRADLDASAATARSAANGQTALATGDAYQSYGDRTNAIAMYRLALEKGGIDAGTANLRLASALVASGQTAEARTLLEAVTGPRADLAKYWLVWLDQQSGAAGPAQPAPAAAPSGEPAS